MKTLALLLACACGPCFAACVQEDCPAAGRGRDGAAVSAVADILVPMNLSVVNRSRALALASARLGQQLRAGFPERRLPEPAAARAAMMLLLRLNNGWLKTAAGARVYPGEAQFGVWAAAYLKGVEKYWAGLDRAHVWGPVDDAAAQDLLKREIKKGITGLPGWRGRGLPPEPPLTPEEEAYLPALP